MELMEGHHSLGISEMLNNFQAARGGIAALNTTTTLPYQPVKRQGSPTAPQGSRQTFMQQPLASPTLLPTVGGWGVIPCGNPPSLQPCSDTAQLFKSSPDSLPATTSKRLRSQKKVPGCRGWFGLGTPLTPQHPFCRSKQTR